ncbi:MAG TPA: hypothetical protein VMN03_04095, partial [Burkholderiales bacterium]|nr:hypothetical protein [Burkholderiales bacterium]
CYGMPQLYVEPEQQTEPQQQTVHDEGGEARVAQPSHHEADGDQGGEESKSRRQPYLALKQPKRAASRVSDPAFVQAMSAFVRKAVGAEGSVDKAEVLKTVEVIADPKTLLPYRTVVKETKTFAVSAKGEAPRTSVEIEESVTTYSC